MNKQQLANKIWQSANKMRSKIEANEYKDYILGFIFYKFLSEKEEEYLKSLEWTDEYLCELTEEDTETVISVQKNLGYFISYDNLFSTWLKKGSDFSIEDVRVALSAFNRLINNNHKKVFDRIFDTLDTGLSKLGDTAASQSKAVSDLIQLIKDIPMDGRQDYDVLGYIYEYLIEKFASNAGKKAGEFYTPHEVSLLMSEIVAHHLKDKSEIKIYDPTSGSGSLLINIGKCVAKYINGSDNIKYYAQELKQNTYNLTRMNLVMRGILPDNIVTRCADTLEYDWPYFDENDRDRTYDPLYVDAVVSNPPYSQVWNPEDKENDPRYSEFGIAPKSKADYAFLLHDLFHVKHDGIMTIVLPHGVLFRGGEEGEIRKNLIEKNHIDAIIGLPANIFFGTGIPTIIMVLKKTKDNTDTLIIDASKGFIKDGKNNKLRASDIKKIVDTVVSRKTINKYSKLVSLQEIRDNDYNLNIPRYVDSSEEAESWDIYASMFGGIPTSELNTLDKYWEAFPNLSNDLFAYSSDHYCELKIDNLKDTILNHKDIIEFKNNFKDAFNHFDDYLYDELITHMSSLNIHKVENNIADNIFTRIKDIPLIDFYDTYQLLDDIYTKISTDLEIIQTEGIQSIKQVDPILVIKKDKKNKEHEVQDGWKGHIIPFELIQDTILLEYKNNLKNIENKLSDNTSQYQEIFDSLTEDEKEQEFVGEDKFIPKEITKALKSSYLNIDTKIKLQTVNNLIKEEKELKKSLKNETINLEKLTKQTLENITDEQAIHLLKDKWINPFINSINIIPNNIINNFISKLDTLSKKYSTTLSSLDTEIKETEAALSLMIDDLVGNEYDMLGLAEFKKLLGGM